MNYFDITKSKNTENTYPMVLKANGKAWTLHKTNYNFNGFETYCGFQFNDTLAKLPETLEEAGEFEEVCSCCYPNGIDIER